MLIAHLSDPHLRPRGALYHGLVDSNAMFLDAVRHLATLDPQPDLVLLTGDVIEDRGEADYTMAAEMLALVPQPVLVIPGNHDAPGAFRACFGHSASIARSGPLHVCAGDHGPVRILGVDVTVPGAHHGDMDDAACQWLEARLAEELGRPTIVMMHQPPFSTGILYMDESWCRHGHRLADILLRYPAVERVVCGHVHRFMQVRFGGTMLVTAPSTTIATALRLQAGAEPASFIDPPAMLLHHWRRETGLVTHHVPIGAFRGPLRFF